MATKFNISAFIGYKKGTVVEKMFEVEKQCGLGFGYLGLFLPEWRPYVQDKLGFCPTLLRVMTIDSQAYDLVGISSLGIRCVGSLLEICDVSVVDSLSWRVLVVSLRSLLVRVPESLMSDAVGAEPIRGIWDWFGYRVGGCRSAASPGVLPVKLSALSQRETDLLGAVPLRIFPRTTPFSSVEGTNYSEAVVDFFRMPVNKWCKYEVGKDLEFDFCYLHGNSDYRFIDIHGSELRQDAIVRKDTVCYVKLLREVESIVTLRRERSPILPTYMDEGTYADEKTGQFLSGYCYLSLIRPESRIAVAFQLGRYPSLHSLAQISSGFCNSVEDVSQLLVGLSGTCLHIYNKSETLDVQSMDVTFVGLASVLGSLYGCDVDTLFYMCRGYPKNMLFGVNMDVLVGTNDQGLVHCVVDVSSVKMNRGGKEIQGVDVENEILKDAHKGVEATRKDLAFVEALRYDLAKSEGFPALVYTVPKISKKAQKISAEDVTPLRTIDASLVGTGWRSITSASAVVMYVPPGLNCEIAGDQMLSCEKSRLLWFNGIVGSAPFRITGDSKLFCSLYVTVCDCLADCGYSSACMVKRALLLSFARAASITGFDASTTVPHDAADILGIVTASARVGSMVDSEMISLNSLDVVPVVAVRSRNHISLARKLHPNYDVMSVSSLHPAAHAIVILEVLPDTVMGEPFWSWEQYDGGTDRLFNPWTKSEVNSLLRSYRQTLVLSRWKDSWYIRAKLQGYVREASTYGVLPP